jgi:error-prone DNA polymerase
MFIPLTTHSAYSLQEGLLLPSELVQAAQANGLPALGLTDHRLLSDAVEFAVAYQQAGIQPILGLEIGVIECSGAESRLSLLAMNLDDWSNLCRVDQHRYTQPPASARGDSPIGKYHQRARQFYSCQPSHFK